MAHGTPCHSRAGFWVAVATGDRNSKSFRYSRGNMRQSKKRIREVGQEG